MKELQIHVKTVHEKRRDFECKNCERKFSQNASLKQHIKVVHEGKKCFECVSCKKKFGEKGNLKTHEMGVLTFCFSERGLNCRVFLAGSIARIPATERLDPSPKAPIKKKKWLFEEKTEVAKSYRLKCNKDQKYNYLRCFPVESGRKKSPWSLDLLAFFRLGGAATFRSKGRGLVEGSPAESGLGTPLNILNECDHSYKSRKEEKDCTCVPTIRILANRFLANWLWSFVIHAYFHFKLLMMTIHLEFQISKTKLNK